MPSTPFVVHLHELFHDDKARTTEFDAQSIRSTRKHVRDETHRDHWRGGQPRGCLRGGTSPADAHVVLRGCLGFETVAQRVPTSLIRV